MKKNAITIKYLIVRKTWRKKQQHQQYAQTQLAQKQGGNTIYAVITVSTCAGKKGHKLRFV